jgi:hypothetical protein
MTRIYLSILSFLLVVADPGLVEGFSSSAAGCNTGPIAGEHVNNLDGAKTVEEQTWNTIPITLTIDGIPIGPNSVTTYETGKVLTIKLIGVKMKGVLIRLMATPINVDITNDVILPAIATKIAKSCKAPVVGLSHFSPNEKVVVSGTMKFRDAADITLDASVVFAANDIMSVYTNATFTLRICKRTTCGFWASVFGCRSKCIFI